MKAVIVNADRNLEIVIFLSSFHFANQGETFGFSKMEQHPILHEFKF